MLHVLSAAHQIIIDFILTDTILNYSVFIADYNMSISNDILLEIITSILCVLMFH